MIKPITFSFKSKILLAFIFGLGTLGLNAQTITTFPWTETFESNSPSRQYWTQIYEVGTMAWTYTSDNSTGPEVTAYDGTLFANYPATSHNFETTKLVSPVLNMAGMTNASVSFYYINPYWNPDQNILRVYYRTSAASPWVQVAIFNTDIDVWTSSGTISLPNTSATYQIAIECWTDYGYATLVDHVVVTGTASSVDVESVAVSTEDDVPAEITVQNGTLQLEAVVNPSGANQNVTWSVVNGSAFGSVNTSGLVTGTASGTITVRATSVEDTTIFDEIDITIAIPIEVESVVISTEDDVPAEITVQDGTLQLEAVVNPSEVSQEVTWSVVNGSTFGSVNTSGLVTGTASGTITVRATSVEDTTIFDEIDITIAIPIEVESVVISTEDDVPAEITEQDGTLQLEAVVNPSEVSQEVTWSVVNGSAFGSVNTSGLVTGTASGTITVRATSVEDTTIFDEIDITIAIPIEVESVVISTENDVPAEITEQDGTLQLEAVVNPSEVSQEVTWSVVNGNEFASINASGLVTAIANGTATIRATSVEDTTIFDEIDVVISLSLGNNSFIFESLQAYPNPVKDVLTITSPLQINTVEVFNITGQKVLDNVVDTNEASVNLAPLSAGTYFVKINAGNLFKTIKVLKI